MAFALTWLTVGMGLAADSVETASNTPMFLVMLPFLSSGFVPTDAMPWGLRQFAEYQPFTPMIDSLRALTSGAERRVGPVAGDRLVRADRRGRLPVVAAAVHEGPDEVEGHWPHAHHRSARGARRRHGPRGAALPRQGTAAGAGAGRAPATGRYDAKAVVDLIRIRTLAEAGVPLSRVKELLAADDEEFAAAVAEIDRRLRAEIRQRQQHRERIARLAAGDSLAAAPRGGRRTWIGCASSACRSAMVEGERDAWILVAAHSPERMTRWMALKREQIEDPEVVELYRRLYEMVDWQPDDPRLPELADWLAAFIANADDWDEYDPEDAIGTGLRRAPRLDLPRLGAGGTAADGAPGGARLVRVDPARADLGRRPAMSP